MVRLCHLRYLNGKIWNGKGYNTRGNFEYEIKNGKGNIKEYDDKGELIFEGEYLNGERNGKGKEYNFYGDVIEGEYLNGKRNGKIKKYNYQDGLLKFEGEYLNGKIWNGKEYDIFGNSEFEMKNGKGFIKEYNYFGRVDYEGEYLNGERNGKGKEYYDNGLLEYEGEYFYGKRNGEGKEF